MKKVALIELNPYHGECLYAQLRFLKCSGYDVTLFCDKSQERSVTSFDVVADQSFFWDMKSFRNIIKIRNFLVANRVETVILNTIQGGRVLKFMLLPFPSQMTFVGTLHNIRKLKDSFGQKLICRKIKGVYLLAEYLKKNFEKFSKIPCSCYSSAYVPAYGSEYVEKKEGEVWAVVPGSIEYKRRDYDFLLDAAKSSDDCVKFILLGNSKKGEGPLFLKKAEDEGILEKFVTFDSFVSNELFHSYMEKCDWLLPLIRGGSSLADDYMNYKVSGTFILAKAYNKPMLLDEAFSRVENFDYPVVYYSDEEKFVEMVKQSAKREACDLSLFESDREKYLTLLNS